MKILFYFGHPSQFMMFRETIRNLKEKDWQIKIIIKTKDVLETLLKDSGFEYENILQKGRANNLLSIFLAVLKRDIRLFRITKRFKPKLMLGTDPSVAHVGWLLKIPSITIVEDDYDVIKNLCRITYPFTKIILCPEVCKVGKYNYKKIGYEGYMKLGYLHPKVFTKDINIINKYNFKGKFVLVRLSALSAYHDFRIGGINKKILDQIIETCNNAGYDIKLSTEFNIEAKYEKYRLNIEIKDMHHVLSAASLLISDSQSMSVEAAMLGTPSIRYSGFAGRISVLEELEKKYELTFGIPISNKHLLFSKLNELLVREDLYAEFQKRKEKMLSEKINLSSYLVWFIENYPQSIEIADKNRKFQFRFS